MRALKAEKVKEVGTKAMERELQRVTFLSIPELEYFGPIFLGGYWGSKSGLSAYKGRHATTELNPSPSGPIL